MYGALFMARKHMVYFGIIVQGIVNGHDGTARISKDILSIFFLQAFDNSLGATYFSDKFSHNYLN
jgi:hypothetical protein